ncbi:hypothetical protein U9M48_000378 [Paspalum notatum var. saurae]|uniref:No apical meristem-associated C-terminal domain-containing protein n=1 Tax=Paspalum notatum var. saurae TaxID=547442 RepID=A0AAQ3SI30_PASNO
MDNLSLNNNGAFDLNDDEQSQLYSQFPIDDSVPLDSPFSPSPRQQPTEDTVTPSSFHPPYTTPPSMNPCQSHPRPPRSSNAKGNQSTTPTGQGCSHRTSSYTVEEDLCLISAWLNISRDPIVSTNQSGDAYWERIYEYYLQHKPPTSDRNKKSLSTRWGTISAAVSRFCGIKAQQDRILGSGYTEADRISASIELYDKENPKQKWAFMHCWEALRNVKKWEDYKKAKARQGLKAQKGKNVEDIEAEPVPIERPMGRDTAKKRRNATPSDSESQCLEVIQRIMTERADRKSDSNAHNDQRAAHQKLKMELLQRQTEVQERQAEIQLRHQLAWESAQKRKQLEQDLRVMEVDPDTLTGPRRPWYIRLQQRIASQMDPPDEDNQGPSA